MLNWKPYIIRQCCSVNTFIKNLVLFPTASAAADVCYNAAFTAEEATNHFIELITINNNIVINIPLQNTAASIRTQLIAAIGVLFTYDSITVEKVGDFSEFFDFFITIKNPSEAISIITTEKEGDFNFTTDNCAVQNCYILDFDMLFSTDLLTSLIYGLGGGSFEAITSQIDLQDTVANIRTLLLAQIQNTGMSVEDVTVVRTDIGGSKWHYTITIINPIDEFNLYSVSGANYVPSHTNCS